jgi:hypothetical protein
MAAHTSGSPQKSAIASQVGLLTRRQQRFCEPFHLPRQTAEWYNETAFLTHSGGTVPVSHRLPFYARLGT